MQEERIKKVMREEFREEGESNRKLVLILFALVAVGVISASILITNLLSV